MPGADIPQLSSLNLSLVKQLQLYTDFIKELKNCSRKQEILASYMFPQDWPCEFVSEEGQKLNMLLYYALLNMVGFSIIE